MSHRDLHLDFNLAFDPSRQSGISEEDFTGATAIFIQVHRALHAMQEMGQVQFMHLPYLEETLRQIEGKGRKLQDRFETMVVCGIGGSALGAKAILEAIQGPTFTGNPPSGKRKLVILDTLDPSVIRRTLENLNLKRTVFSVISKSGNTVETMAQFMVLHELLREKIGEKDFRKHIVFITDPEKGALRKIAQEEGFECFEILKGVGGRFSVLSPVGLLPAAFLGVSIQEMAEGAIRMDKRCKVEDLWTNPAAMLALVTFLLSERQGRRQWVLFNYVENLNACVEWFCQLWAESLGKRFDLRGKEIRAGTTPIMASGPRDQHSQVQLYVEGPLDKIAMFWSQEKFPDDFEVPKIYSQVESLGYLGGKKLSEILHAEILATEQALKDSGVPSFRMMVYEPDAYSLGQLFFALEVATVYVGGLLNVNPYDQPGVELGKKYIYGRLGRPGFEEYGAQLLRKLKDKRYIV